MQRLVALLLLLLLLSIVSDVNGGCVDNFTIKNDTISRCFVSILLEDITFDAP